jgi:cytoskeletal protein RodZ
MTNAGTLPWGLNTYMAEMMQDGLAANPVGDRLRTAREAKGMSLDDVAATTRVPTRHLQHIENGDWDALPAVTYSVGFARSYAKAVGLDGREIGNELRTLLGAPQSAASAPYEPADPARVPPRSLALIAAVIALVLVAGYFLWRGNAVADSDPATDAAAVETPIVAQPNPPRAQSAAGASPAVAAVGPVVLTATDDVWLRVSDAGTVLVQRTLKAGESYQVPATAQRPELRAGRPDALRVMVGQAVIPQLGPSGRPIGNVSLLAADLSGRLQAAPAPTPQPPAAR